MRIFIIFILVLLLTISVNSVYIDKNINSAFKNNNEVNVIITFSNKSDVLKKDFSSSTLNLNKNDFDGRFYKNSEIAAGKISEEGMEKLKQDPQIERIDFV